MGSLKVRAAEKAVVRAAEVLVSWTVNPSVIMRSQHWAVTLTFQRGAADALEAAVADLKRAERRAKRHPQPKRRSHAR